MVVEGLGDLRESLNHFNRRSSIPETALAEISLDRASLRPSMAESVPSSLSESCPFAIPFRLADELGLVLRFPCASFALFAFSSWEKL